MSGFEFKSRSFSVVVIIIALLVTDAAVCDAFGVKPVLLRAELRRGSRDMTEILVYSTREVPESVRLYVTHYQFKRDGLLDLSTVTEEETKNLSLPSLELSETELLVRPGQEIPLRITTSMPSTAIANEYVFAIVVEAVDADVVQRPGQPSVGIRQRVAVPMIINVPGRRDRFGARFIDVSGQARPDGYYIVASMENTGNRYVDASGIARIRDDSGKIIHTMPLIAVSVGSVQKLGVISILPGGIRDFFAPIRFPLKAGTYKVEIIGSIRQNERLRLIHTGEITIEHDLAETYAETEPLKIEPARLELKLRPGGSSVERIEVANIFLDDLTLEISSDSELVQTSRIPVLVPVGATRSLQVKVRAPLDGDLNATVTITVQNRDHVVKIPVLVILQKEI